jgi:hypothetical protein
MYYKKNYMYYLPESFEEKYGGGEPKIMTVTKLR